MRRHREELALVVLGGVLGTAARAALALLIPAAGPIPVVIAAINISGAFLLALLLGVLTRRAGGDVAAHRLRLSVGVGALGGFTSYSALATDTVVLIAGDELGFAVAYAFGTVILGALATWAGLLSAGTGRSAATEGSSPAGGGLV